MKANWDQTVVFAAALWVGSACQAAVSISPVLPVLGHAYTATAQYPRPLDTFEACLGPDPASDSQLLTGVTQAGLEAFLAAKQEALNACHNQYNADCKVVSAEYREIISLEFIGYKACEAKVVVHGYQLEN